MVIDIQRESKDLRQNFCYLLVALILVPASVRFSSCQQVRQLKEGATSDPALEAGINLARKGDFTGAEKAFGQAVTLHPTDPRALTALGQVQDELEQYPEAIATFRKVIALDPLSADAHENLGIALGDRSDLAQALQESRTAIRLAPNSAGAHFLCGRVLSGLGEYEEARHEFQKVLEIAPGYAEALYQWAELEGHQGNRAAQASLLERYVKLRPDQTSALVQLGNVCKEEHRDAEAISAWRRALALNPNDSAAMYSLAIALQRTNPAESKELLKRLRKMQADQLATDRINILGNQAYVAMCHADYKKAIDYLDEGMALCGQCQLQGTLEKEIGLAYCHAGQLDAGERELNSAKKLNPGDASIDEALKVLKQQREQARTDTR